MPNAANILSAEIIFTSRGTSTDTAEFTIKGIDEDEVTQFSSTPDDITDRTTTTTSVAWSADVWNVAAAEFPTDDIKDIVQEIVDRPGWVSGNSIGFIIETTTGTRIAETADGDASKSPQLSVVYQSTVDVPIKTNRERLIELVNGL